MLNVFEGAGWFLLPLGLCSTMAIFIMVERLIALRSSRVIPHRMIHKFVKGEILNEPGDQASVAGRILAFFHSNRPDPDALKAFATLETTRLERGLFILEIVIGAAPLLGLLGTVTGLMQVFSGLNVDSGVPDPATFVRGIAMALGTTMLGLVIAIPALVGNAYLNRRVEMLSARINVGVERLIDLAKKSKPQSTEAKLEV